MLDEEMLGDGDLDLDEEEDKQIEEKKISSVWITKHVLVYNYSV